MEASIVSYSTVQNWYGGNSTGVGGVYNFVTKRSVVTGMFGRVSWTQVESGSSITWKYPSIILLAPECIGDFYSLALTKFKQQSDTGTKIIHGSGRCKSYIMS